MWPEQPDKYRKLANKDNTYRFIISGGGTGGHIYPAIAIADALKAELPAAEILFVGAIGRMEMQKVPEAGYPIKGLPISGLQRKLTAANLSFPLKVIRSLRQASAILKDFKPQAAIGVGGYASGPLLYQASRLGIPCLIQEQNSYPGITNKLLAKRVKRICVAHDDMDRFFPTEKIVFTGNPVRKDILEVDSKRAEAFRFFNLDPAKKTILSIGGSLGARTLNESLFHSLDKFLKEDIQLIWQTGRFYYADMAARLAGKEDPRLKLLEFLREMDLAYAAADVVISRAGALSVSELCLARKPAIFVPSPNVSEDHQTKNAMALVNKDAALMVKDVDAVAKLADQAIALVRDEQLQNKLSKNIAVLGRPEAAKDIVKEILKIID
jgi:UDP-N-acetylglucosamine--N-acetylmuramyl-(pentapeptide) pyrophosphoryl-undecaprenol N-acetylglucosamine transferase